MRLNFPVILTTAVLRVTGAEGALHHDAFITISEPASLALLGAVLLCFAKLLRKRLRS